jgi:hypothetical protein
MAKARGRARSAWELVHDLEAVTRVDTAFADLYLRRARELAAGELGEAEFEALQRSRDETDELPARIQAAMERSDWKEVKEASARLSALRKRLEDTRDARAAAEKIYDLDRFVGLVDPFSPGLQGLAGVAEADRPALQQQGRKLLEGLRTADPEQRALYEARLEALGRMEHRAEAAAAPGASTATSLRNQARQAMASGDLQRLQEISARLMEEEAREAVSGPGRAAGRSADEGLPSLTFTFGAGAIEQAGRLGLAPVHVASIRDQLEGIYRHAWEPTRGEAGGGGLVRVPISLPSDSPEALRERLQLYLNRPFVNSAGARFLPYLVAEDALVEGFDEPSADAPEPNRPLLDALGLPQRSGLGRRRIERALLAHGGEAVRKVGLDPLAFRLVCIPPDLHARVGRERGWGTQPRWTHLDGYMVQGRKLLALAGGDVRFGGIFDLVGLGMDYDSDRLMARFAVVQRRRMAAW